MIAGRWTIFVALLLATGAARAADCSKAITQADMNICSGQDFKAADAALNQAYDRLVKAPEMADRLDKLRAAERTWVEFRTAQCAFDSAAYEGGSMQPMVASGCAAALTKERTKVLDQALACARSGGGC